jgi:hypothetical protein
MAAREAAELRASEQLDEARRRIKKARGDGSAILDLSDLLELSSLPAEIGDFVDLRALDLSRTNVSDLAAIAGLPALDSLSVDDTNVSDLAAISGLPTLRSLSVNGTQVSDLAAIPACRLCEACPSMAPRSATSPPCRPVDSAKPVPQWHASQRPRAHCRPDGAGISRLQQYTGQRPRAPRRPDGTASTHSCRHASQRPRPPSPA